MKIARHIIASVAILAVAIGCAGGNGASNRPAPDRAALSVLIRAEPKKGWREDQATVYDFGQIGAGRAFETIDYRGLDDIVVWVQPGETEPASGAEVAIDVSRAGSPLFVAGMDDTWLLRNAAPEPLAVYARHEAGRVSDIGTILPGASLSYRGHEAGLVEILSDSRAEPLARVYVAPIPTTSDGQRARVARSGQKVLFNNLPPGPARVGCWHGRLPGSDAQVNLSAGAVTPVTLRVSVNQLPPVP